MRMLPIETDIQVVNKRENCRDLFNVCPSERNNLTP
jgi:hypothetical protein